VALSSENLATMGNGIHASSAVPYAVMALLLAAVIIAAGRAVINAPSPHQQLRGGQPPGGRTSGAQGIFAPAFTTAGQNPYTPGELALLALAGLVIALAGALGPAIWAAASRTTTALRAE
jgi:putative ABC transport system permease protein